MNGYQRIFFLIMAFIICRLISLFPDVMSVIVFAGALLVILFEWLAQREKGNL